MKKIVSIAVAIVLTSGLANAEFAKALQETDGPMLLTVSGHAGNTGDTAVTVYFLAKRFDVVTGSAGPLAQFVLSDQKITKGSRIIVEIDLPTPVPGGISQATISVSQTLGGGAFSRTVDGQADGHVFRFVFDVM